MQLIKSLGKGLGLFLCSYCNSEVKKCYSNGKKQKSCGCVKGVLISKTKVKHGDAVLGNVSRLHRIWQDFRKRCFNSNRRCYKNYGGRGITYVEEWDDFEVFKKWAISNGYRDNLTIDRIENNKGYYPDNCRWIIKPLNSRYRSTTILNMKQAREIRKKYLRGCITQKQLGIEYNVSKETVGDIIRGRTWREGLE